VRDEDKLRAELGGKPSDPASPQGSEALPGVQLSALTDEIRRGMDVPAGTEGLVVTKVAKGSDAASKGITEGDIIVAVGNQPVKAVADVTAAVGAAKGQGRKSVLILLERRGVRQYLAVNIG
jgi:serine protease Do